ncbi:MAG: hypothetical protein IMY72_08845 [Bacteroidetes bacterium]|nr:hypothetical protein [Bacteroidota bacterium]
MHETKGGGKLFFLYDAVYREMNIGKNWFKLRTNTKPCCNCLYNTLCPPISNYEYALGKYNLCNVYNLIN